MKKLIFKINCIFLIIILFCMPIYASVNIDDIPVDKDVVIHSYKVEKKQNDVDIKKGIVKEAGKKYLYDDKGRLLKNYFYADKNEKKYYSDENGMLVTDTFVLINYKTASNIRHRYFNDKVYYFNYSGIGHEIEGKLANSVLNAEAVKKTFEYENIDKAKIGDFVKFGYYNDNHTDLELEWEILDKTNDRLLLISKFIVLNMKYEKYDNDELDKSMLSWKNSNVRIFLNNKFINSVFKDNKYYNKILETKILDNNEFVDDKIFILSNDEITKYYDVNKFDSNGDLSNSNAYTMAYHFVNDIYVERDNPLYLSLSPYMTRNINLNDNTISVVKASGELGYSNLDNSYGIRPAMWIKY